MTVLSGVGAVTVNIPLETYEHARGDNVTLPCKFVPKAPNPSTVIITWSAEAEEANAKSVRLLRCVHILYVHVCDSLLSVFHNQLPYSLVLCDK